MTFSRGSSLDTAASAAASAGSPASSSSSIRMTQQPVVNAFRAVQAASSPSGSISISPAALSVSEGSNAAELVLHRSGGSSGTVSVSWYTDNGTALNGRDFANYFTPEELIVTWADGDASAKVILVPLIDNLLLDGDRTFTVGITAPTGGASLDAAASQSVVTILNNDLDYPPNVSAPPTVSGVEGAAIAFSVYVTDPNGEVATSLTASGLPAGASFTPAPDVSSGDFAWTPAPGEAGSYPILFEAVSGVNSLTGSATTTITVVTPSLSPVVTAPATVSSPAGISITFQVTATDPDGDLIERMVMSGLSKTTAQFSVTGINTPLATGTFTWTPLATQTTTFTFTASNGCATLPCLFSGSASTQITVTPGSPTLSIQFATYTVGEALGQVAVSVTRTVSSTGAVSVDYATVDGTAFAGTDYGSTSGTLSWASGVTTPKTVVIPIIDNAEGGGDMQFLFTLSNPQGGAVINRSSAPVTILNDDASAGTIAFEATSYSYSESEGLANLVVSRTGGADGEVSVSVVTDDTFWAEAIDGVDYVGLSSLLTWPAGDATPKVVSISLIPNDIADGNRRFRAILSDPSGGAILGTNSATDITIVDDDLTPPALSVTPLSHDFGPVELGANGTVAVSIQNTGGGTLNVALPALASGAAEGFSLAGAAPLALGAGASVSFSANFQPTALGGGPPRRGRDGRPSAPHAWRAGPAKDSAQRNYLELRSAHS